MRKPFWLGLGQPPSGFLSVMPSWFFPHSRWVSSPSSSADAGRHQVWRREPLKGRNYSGEAEYLKGSRWHGSPERSRTPRPLPLSDHCRRDLRRGAHRGDPQAQRGGKGGGARGGLVGGG